MKETKDLEDQELSMLMKSSVRRIPADDLEDNVMREIHSLIRHKRETANDLKWSFLTGAIGVILMCIATFFFWKSDITLYGLNKTYCTLFTFFVLALVSILSTEQFYRRLTY